MNYTPDPNRITYFASTHTRGKRRAFGIRAKDRDKHMYIIGKSGMGKSTLLENMAIQDIQNGEGLAFIDPHGSTAEKLLEFVPQERIKDVLYFAPFDTENPIGFNVMEDVGYDKRHLVVSGLMGAFHRIWEDAWSARMEYILQNTLLALLEYPNSTLLDVNRMLVSKDFRADVVAHIQDPIVKAFWAEEFAGYSDRYTQDATPAIQNKIGQFISNPLVRNIVGQPESTFNLRDIMDDRKIFIVNLSKGRMGETNASLLGSMLVVKIYLTAMSRADESSTTMRNLPPFYFYVDEFQSVVNQAFANILSEARKYKLCLTIANQYIEQMDEEVRAAVFGNVGTFMTFRVGPFDAEVLKTVFEPTFHPEDLVNLGLGQIYLSLMINGVGSAPFSAETLPPVDPPTPTFVREIIEYSKRTFGKERSVVEEIVQKRQNSHVKDTAKNKNSESKKPYNQQQQRGRDNEQRHDSNRRERVERDRPQREPQTEKQAPRPQKDPAEVLRAIRAHAPHQKNVEKQIQEAPKKKPDAVGKNSLQDAIRAATQGSTARPASTPQPRARQEPERQQKSQPQPRPTAVRQEGGREERGSGEISPQELRRIVNGE